MRDLTKFTFFKNTPLIDFQNTILFNSNTQRDNFFLKSNHYETLETGNIPFNFVRDRSTLNVPISYDEFRGVNYCTFLSEKEPNTRYYAYVINYEYLNDKVTRVYLLIDGIMTYCQGEVLNELTNLNVKRRHLFKAEYNNRLWELKNNGDVLKTSTKGYFYNKDYFIKDFDIIIQCTCDLTADFGNVDDPKIETSEGITFDKISSPVNLYHVEQRRLKDFMKALAPYPWISQNITSVNMIPKSFINQKDLTPVTMKSSNFNGLSVLKNGGKSNKLSLEEDIKVLNMSMNELYELFGLNEDEKHLLRSEYTTTEVYTWDGQQMLVDNGLLSETTGIEFRALIVTGYHNEIALYLNNYKRQKNSRGTETLGSFLNDSIFFRNFDDIPILVDNYNLALSKSANQRQLAESQLVTNRLSNVFDNSANTRDRFFDATALLSNLSPMNFFGKFVDEHNFYQQQKAEMADLALSTPTLTNQSNNNALKRSENFYGVTIKYSKPTDEEMTKLKKYYKMFGFEVNEENSSINVRTNTIADFVQFSGSWTIPNADVALIEQMKAQFENGVRLWHNNNTPNPMTQNILNNKMK